MKTDPQAHDEGPILPGSALARALDREAVPRLSPGFADRVVAAAEARPAPLPPLRRTARWRTGRRLVVGMAGVMVLASAAAATGLLQQVVPSVPSPKVMWASLTGSAKSTPTLPRASAPAPAPVAQPTSVAIAGAIDTPEELAEAFARADERRNTRREVRRALIERRLADALAQRKSAGLPEPTPEELATLRERLAAREGLRNAAVDARIQVRREELQRRVESGEALTREDLRQRPRPVQPLPGGSETFERLRQMTPAERREAVRAMPAAERAALREELRARRSPGLIPPPAQPVSPLPSASPAE